MKELVSLMTALPLCSGIHAQTLSVPNGTAGVGNSQNANVGVGTDNPSEKLHVTGTIGVGALVDAPDAGLRIQYVDGGAGTTTFRHTRWGGHTYFTRNSSLGDRTQFYFGGSQHHQMDIYDNNNNVAVRFASGGNSFLNAGYLGIGTSNPQYKLDIKGQDLLLNNNTSSIHLRTDGNGNAFINNMNNFVGNGSITNGYLALTGQSMLRFNVGNAGSSGTERMRITDTGNIGIGTSNPAGKLHVLSSIAGGASHSFSDLLVEDVNRGMVQVLTGNAGVGYFGFADSDDDYVGGIQYEHNGDQMVFRVNNHAADVVINNSGYMGIGASAPDSPLTVNGSIHAEEVKVDLSVPAPDYVFEEDYPLQSLTDVEAYINEHEHLPEVPSAKEMDEKGVKVGEMAMILLKKIEELTLYMIEVTKVNEQQAEHIRLQQQAIELLQAKLNDQTK